MSNIYLGYSFTVRDRRKLRRAYNALPEDFKSCEERPEPNHMLDSLISHAVYQSGWGIGDFDTVESELT